MKKQEIETLARFAACLLANPSETQTTALGSFTDSREVVEIAKLAWAEIEKNGGFVEETTDGYSTKERTKIVEVAREHHQQEGVCEIDANAVISAGDDDGVYVQAWVWVRGEDIR